MRNHDKPAVRTITILFMFVIYGEKKFYTLSNLKTTKKNFEPSLICGLHCLKLSPVTVFYLAKTFKFEYHINFFSVPFLTLEVKYKKFFI